jgi:glycosyltransferase involved in cell wall biosynthesis
MPEIAARIGRPDAPVPPGVSRGRSAWLEHGYLPLEAALTRLGHVVTPSQAMADFLLAHGFSPWLLRVIPLGVETGTVRAGDGHDVLVAGVAANLEYWKDRRLARAARLVEAPLRLEIYGDARSVPAELQAREGGIDARFHGFVADVRERLRSSTCSCSLRAPTTCRSRSSRRWRPAFRSWAPGRWDPGTGRRRRDGVVVEPESPRALADALEQLAGDPDRARKLGRNGAERAAEHFSPDGVAARMVALYEELCASST